MPPRRRLVAPALTPPNPRVSENDQKVLDAAERVLLALGWSGLTLAAIMREAGLSNRAIRSRFSSPAHAAALLWQLRLGPTLLGALASLMASAGLLEADADPERFAERLRALSAPSDEVSAAAELLVVAHYTPLLATSVDADLGAALRAWAGPEAAASDPVRATQRAYLSANALGLVLSAHRRHGHEVDLTSVAAAMLTSLARPGAIIELPAAPARATRETPAFGSGDEGLEALLAATVMLIVQHGFDGASTAAIAREAGFTEGFLFRRYESKQALFIDTLARLQAVALRENAELMQALVSEHGPVYAEAMAYRDGMLPERRKGRVLALEYERVSARAPLLRAHAQRESAALLEQHAAAQPQVPAPHLNGAIFSALASGIGMAALPLLIPGVEQLPFSVIARSGPGGS